MDMTAVLRRLACSGDRGQTLPIVGVALVALLGAAALAVDVGYWRYQQRVEQSAVDSAAIAAAGELAYPGGTIAIATAAAKKDAASNGYADGVGSVTVVVNNPPATGAYTTNAKAVEVLLQKRQPGFFGAILGQGSQGVGVRAVAIANTSLVNCVYALTGDITVNGTGGGGLNEPNCGLQTNVNLNVTGTAVVNARSIGYVGTGPAGGVYPSGQPQQAIPAVDPCPTIPSCAYLTDLTLNHPSQLHTGCMPQSSPLPNPLPPGEYCSTLVPKGNQSFSPGLFVLDNGMSATGNETLTGTGVTFYNGGGAHTLTGITYSGNVNTSFTAPTTGPLAGMVFYQPASNTTAFTVNGRAGTDNFAGAVYLPTAPLVMNGNLPTLSLLVAASITLNGGGMSATANAGLPNSGHPVLAE